MNGYYVVSKGLYVGIFNDWQVGLLSFGFILLMLPRHEVEPWVLGVPRSTFRNVRSWEEARDLYNIRLASGTVQVLA